MKKQFLILSLIFILIISYLYIGKPYDYLKNTNDTQVISNDLNNESNNIDEKIASMSLDEKICQLIIAGFDGYTVDNNLKTLIKDKHVGSVILYERNVQNSAQLLNLINDIKDLNKDNVAPLFISTDEEGGTVSRMPKEFLRLPNNSEIGKIDDENFSYNIGKIIGTQLSSFGFNMDFAPVLDINSNPNNPVIGARSFGNDKDLISRLGVQTMKGINSENVIPVIKHFPGHGDTSVDSHLGLPIVEHPFSRLNNFELVPFKKAIENGADAVMIAHILLPKLDKENPSTLSKTIITDILRENLKFDGVVITDDMTMGAITKNYNIGDAAVKSINAGSDLILVSHGIENINTVIDSIKSAVNNNIISEDRINKSVYRILSLKEKYALNNDRIDFVDVDKINSDINFTLKKYIK